MSKKNYEYLFIALWPESQSVMSSQGAVVEFSFAESLDEHLKNLLELSDRGSWLLDNLEAMYLEEEEGEEEDEAPYAQAMKKLDAIQNGKVKGAAAVKTLLELMEMVEGMDGVAEIKWTGNPAEIFSGTSGFAESLRKWYRAYVAFQAAQDADEEGELEDVEEIDWENADDSPLSPKEQADFIEVMCGIDEDAVGYRQLVEIVE
jgi:hypothetical protein